MTAPAVLILTLALQAAPLPIAPAEPSLADREPCRPVEQATAFPATTPGDVLVAMPTDGEDGDRILTVNNTDIAIAMEPTACGYLAAVRVPGHTDAAIAFHIMSHAGPASVVPVDWVAPGFRTRTSDTLPATDPIRIDFASAAMGTPREIYIYWSRGTDPTEVAGILYSGDGLAAGRYSAIAEDLYRRGLIHPVAIVSARFSAGYTPDDNLVHRTAEYVPTRAAFAGTAETLRNDLFQRHLAFFTQELIAGVEPDLFASSHTPERHVFGISASGSFALYAALARPDLYRGAYAGSPVLTASLREHLADDTTRRPVSMTCGSWEGDLCAQARNALQTAGIAGDTLTERPANHAAALWEEGFAEYLIRHFGTD